MTFQEVERLRVGDRVVRGRGTRAGLGGTVVRVGECGVDCTDLLFVVRWDHNPDRDAGVTAAEMVYHEREGTA